MNLKPGLLTLALGILLPCSAAANTDELDKLVSQWVQLTQQASQLENQWLQRQPILQQQLALLEAERASLSTLLSQDNNQSDDIAQQRQALLAEQTRLEQGQDKLSFMLAKNQKQLNSLYRRLPPALKDMWDKQLALLDQAESNSERLQKQLVLMDSLDNFSQRLATHAVDMTFADGNRVQVEQIYLGLSQGWYVSRDGSYWGKGVSTASGWQWQHQPESVSAAHIQQLLLATSNSTQGGLLNMPISLQGED